LAPLGGWSACLKERLVDQVAGLPHAGWWTSIPYAYIVASLKLGDVEGAKDLVTLSYNTLKAAKFSRGPIPQALQSCRALSIKVYQRLDSAISNLADDLYQSLFASPDNFRGEFFALLWTLGLVPESQLMRRPGFAPSRSFVKKIVQASLHHIPYDPLVQYIWLEMKDRPPFRLRDHRPLFDKINLRYAQYRPDGVNEIPPSRAYAQTLTAWFNGVLSSDQVGVYLSVIEQVRQYEPMRKGTDRADWSVFLRMISLAYILARQFDYFEGDVSLAQERDIWLSLWSKVVGMRGKFDLNPNRDLSGTLNYPLFHVIAGDLAAQPGDDPWSVTCAGLIEALEQYRAAAMSYSLAVTPPFPGVDEAAALEDGSAREKEMLQWLRGAYFLVQYEYLPDHFRSYATDMIGDGPKKGFDRDTGLKEYDVVLKKLQDLYKDLEQAAPRYVRQRVEPHASLERILAAISSHSNGSTLSRLTIFSKDKSLPPGQEIPGQALSV
jgi:hypothetical protein